MRSVIDRFFRKVQPRPAGTAQAHDRSPFGGFWTDRRDGLENIDRLASSRAISDDEGRLLRFWIENGFVILPGAVDVAQVDDLQAAIDRAIDCGARQMTYWDASGKHQGPARRDKLFEAECKVIDVHACIPEVRRAIFAPKIARFIELVMNTGAIAFQTLYFERGSEQGLHQDTAFVYVDPPLEFVASWISLEDIQPGSGELMYYPGSHRLPDALFGDPPSKALRPGDPAATTYSEDLESRCKKAGLQKQLFRPMAGDALMWAADLAHGGAPRALSPTRRSLVTHYCPVHRRPPYAAGSRCAEPLPGGHGWLSRT